ncbi:MAG: S9 family peptidase [Candidatus Eisenbacteria bacterium]|uniref:S9 family peptidase n=1 Tax=Eiseniibacteriota bacterium TaxID=2212470 RepID=A0A538U994_UNCEI|nr:MAG: S9 family peptidase [Candidatus Eisenbacteria bacterium]
MVERRPHPLVPDGAGRRGRPRGRGPHPGRAAGAGRGGTPDAAAHGARRAAQRGRSGPLGRVRDLADHQGDRRRRGAPAGRGGRDDLELGDRPRRVAPDRRAAGRAGAARLPDPAVPAHGRAVGGGRHAGRHARRGAAQRPECGLERGPARAARGDVGPGRAGHLVLLVAGHARRRSAQGDQGHHPRPARHRSADAAGPALHRRGEGSPGQRRAVRGGLLDRGRAAAGAPRGLSAAPSHALDLDRARPASAHAPHAHRPLDRRGVRRSGRPALQARGPPDGQRPFLDRMDLATGRTTRVFESDAAHLEPVVVLLAADGKPFITLRQSNREAPNYFVRKAGEQAGRALSDFTDPAPALTASQRFQFKFTRSDSVVLNAEAVLPADWKPGTRLPTIFWVYPNDYRSAAAASQNRRSPNRFPSQSTLNPEVLVTQGYAVVYPDIAVVGTNDKYVEEIGMSAKAAIDECARRGFCDPERVGVGGHSYGAFSTANLLAHTDLFKAGTASDGAYNRALTPFTFQAEERTLWEAPDTYLAMSPFLHADHIDRPLLLLHNLDDTNVGTNPIQSQRMFEALNGLGKTVTLVEYPYEDHGPVARETVLDYWARLIDWFDRYVKKSPGGAAAPAGGSAR